MLYILRVALIALLMMTLILLFLGTFIPVDTYQSVLSGEENGQRTDEQNVKKTDQNGENADTGGSEVLANIAEGLAGKLSVDLAVWAASKLGSKIYARMVRISPSIGSKLAAKLATNFGESIGNRVAERATKKLAARIATKVVKKTVTKAVTSATRQLGKGVASVMALGPLGAIQLGMDVAFIVIDGVDPRGFNNFVPNEDINGLVEELLSGQYTDFGDTFPPFTPDYIGGEHQTLWVDTASKAMNDIHTNALMRLPEQTLQTYLDQTITDALDRMERSGQTDIEDFERIEEFIANDGPQDAVLADAINKKAEELFSAECIATILCTRFNKAQSDYTYEVIPCVSKNQSQQYAVALTQESATKWNLANKTKWKEAFDIFVTTDDRESMEPPIPMALYTDTLFKPDPANSDKGIETKVPKGCYVGANMGMIYSYCEKSRHAPEAGATTDPTKYGTYFDFTKYRCIMSPEFCDAMNAGAYEKGDDGNGTCKMTTTQEIGTLLLGGDNAYYAGTHFDMLTGLPDDIEKKITGEGGSITPQVYNAILRAISCKEDVCRIDPGVIKDVECEGLHAKTPEGRCGYGDDVIMYENTFKSGGDGPDGRIWALSDGYYRKLPEPSRSWWDNVVGNHGCGSPFSAGIIPKNKCVFFFEKENFQGRCALLVAGAKELVLPQLTHNPDHSACPTSDYASNQTCVYPMWKTDILADVNWNHQIGRTIDGDTGREMNDCIKSIIVCSLELVNAIRHVAQLNSGLLD